MTVDQRGTVHMVFDNFHRGIWYTRSKDGTAWNEPAERFSPPQDRSASHPRLIVRGERAAMVYVAGGANMRHGTFEGNAPKMGRPVKIATHTAPLSGAGGVVATEGKLHVVVGSKTLWRLTAELKDILRPAPSQ